MREGQGNKSQMTGYYSGKIQRNHTFTGNKKGENKHIQLTHMAL